LPFGYRALGTSNTQPFYSSGYAVEAREKRAAQQKILRKSVEFMVNSARARPAHKQHHAENFPPLRGITPALSNMTT